MIDPTLPYLSFLRPVLLLGALVFAMVDLV